MNEALTTSEAKQIMDFLQAMDTKLNSHIARTDEQFKMLRVEVKVLNERVDALRTELRDDMKDLRAQERITDSRLWTFVVGLVTLVGGSVIKVLWFDRA